MSTLPANRGEEKGSAFIVVTIFAVVATVVVGAFFAGSLARVRDVDRQVLEVSAREAAESGLNTAIGELWARFRVATEGDRVARLDRLDGKFDPDEQFRVPETVLGRSRFSVLVTAVRASGRDFADVEFLARGINAGAARTLRVVVRYGHRPAEPFDYGYFINNFGWLCGAGVTVNGNVRSNGNFECRSAEVNGDIFAAENEDLSALGTINGDLRCKPLDSYNEHAPLTARPTSPSAPPEDANGNGELDPGEDRDGNGELDRFPFPGGYDGTPDRQEHHAPLPMPCLGDLAAYRKLAAEKGGTISQGGTTLVSGVLGDDAGEARDLLLVGIAAHPIVVHGPVVVEGDVVIKGAISGQGTIYAGRNVHFVGDVTYVHPPSWPKPMVDAEAVKAANAGADLVGFVAKGSIVIGDYTRSSWTAATRNYQRPPFTQPYVVDSSDASNGYVTSSDARGRPVFHGDYTREDGGRKGVDTGALSSRRFYESSFSDGLIQSVSDSSIRQIDGILYTNHLLSGKLDAATFNGALVCRDEGVVYDGSMTVNYDARATSGSSEFLDICLPREPTYRTLAWRDTER